MDAKSDFPGTLKYFICKFRAPNHLFPYNAWEQVSTSVIDILCHYNIGGPKRSEPYQQNQNPADCRIQDIKCSIETTMDHTGTPASMWLLCFLFIVGLFNHVSQSHLQNMDPITKATGQAMDVSQYQQFHWLQHIYYYNHDKAFPSTSGKSAGWWCDPTDQVGDILTYWILNINTKKLVACSNVCSAGNYINHNLRVTFPFLYFHSVSDIIAKDIDPTEVKVPRFFPDELLGLSFLRTLDDGQVVRAQIAKKINDFDALNHQNLKMLVKLGDGNIEELIDFVELCDIIVDIIDDKEANLDRHFIYKGIIEHQGPLKPTRDLNIMLR